MSVKKTQLQSMIKSLHQSNNPATVPVKKEVKSLVTTKKKQENDSTDEDYYKILNVQSTASMLEIRRAYRKLALIWHPDHNSDPVARVIFENINKAYLTLSDPKARETYNNRFTLKAEPRDFKQIDYHPDYRNEVTFLNWNRIESIPKDRLLILDGYAFDVNELEEYARNDLTSFYKNPHLEAGGEEFSEHAKNQLRAHPILRNHALELDAQLFYQASKIRPQTIDAVITMLQAINKNGLAGVDNARAIFLMHKDTLSVTDQQNLDNFIIKTPTNKGGTANLKFSDAFMGGNRFAPCIVVMQIYLWQFVLMLRPEAKDLVPESVHRAAAGHGLRIGNNSGAQQSNSNPSSQQMPPLLADILLSFTVMEIEMRMRARMRARMSMLEQLLMLDDAMIILNLPDEKESKTSAPRLSSSVGLFAPQQAQRAQLPDEKKSGPDEVKIQPQQWAQLALPSRIERQLMGRVSRTSQPTETETKQTTQPSSQADGNPPTRLNGNRGGSFAP